jgi:transposase
MASSLNFVFSRTGSSTPSQSAPRGSGAVSDRDNHAHAMSSPSGDYRAISTPRQPPISGHLGENSVPTFEHENADFVPTPTPGSGSRARRRTRLEIYGSVPTRRTSRCVGDAREREVISTTEVPFFRLPNTNLSTAQKAQFVKAVDDGLTRGISIAETTKQFGLGKNAYHVYAKQIREGTCDPKPKSGRPRKLSEEDKEVLMDVNEDFRGSLTFEEMAREFSTRRGFKISGPTVYRIYKRDGWRSIRKRPCPKLTEAHMETRRQ